MRSHFCGQLDEHMAGTTVTLCGWVQRRRDLGGLIFIGLRDHHGVVQAVIEPDNQQAFASGEQLRNEFCIRLTGLVRLRPDTQRNEAMATGAVEVLVDELEILNVAAPLPLLMSDDDSEETRLRYRYLDLRRDRMQRNLRLRTRLTRALRQYLDSHDFQDLETPILTRATPEGARDYLVPSRVHPGSFYALPQSPQLFKQLLIMGGMDRYYQIARCFRDEDLRADRQPEFTQLDMELAFVDEQDVRATAEALIRHTFREVLDADLGSFPVMSWHEAMQRYGSDKPDLRNPLELISIDALVTDSEFKVFAGPAADKDGRVAALRAPGAAGYSRKQIDDLEALAKKHAAKGLAWMKINRAHDGAAGVQSPIAKFFSDAQLNAIQTAVAAETGDLLFFGAGPEHQVNAFMGAVRLQLGRDLELLEPGWKPLWVVDFPMFEYDQDSARLYALHHPFTAPACSLEQMQQAPEQALSKAYDMVLNGAEIGGGSIRIHRPDMQQAVFDLLGIAAEEAQERFGFLLEALKYGCPPLGGIAFGIDRIAALMAGEASIRDVIAFPKTTTAACPLTQAPSQIDPTQLDELSLQVIVKSQ
ncbi:MAG: aspartate--tRNA ligase [Wenzhouxiangellaceae bacterium]